MDAFKWCDIRPFLAEITARMHEASAAGTNIVNLSASHPRGFIPNQIIRRPAVRALLNGWYYDNSRTVPPTPPQVYWLPKKWGPRSDIETCPLKPFLAEVELRHTEAEQEAKLRGSIPIVDLTTWHPRGGIPLQIIKRINRRNSPEWVKQTRAEIDRLLGQANKDEGFARTQIERADSVDDRSRLEAAAKDLRARAEQYRAQAKWLKEELG